MPDVVAAHGFPTVNDGTINYAPPLSLHICAMIKRRLGNGYLTKDMTRWGLIGLTFLLAGCSLDVPIENPGGSGGDVEGQSARVVSVIDGDTIDVQLDGEEFRVRYIGVNTPERDEVCYSEAVRANRLLVDGKTVTLVTDVSDTDQYGRLLRYVYVGELSVNERMVEEGWAEVVRYAPDTLYYDHFRELEGKAARAGLGCHPTGVFDDGSVTR